MLAIERREKIQEMLNRCGTVKTAELCKALGASPATIRNDLNAMAHENLLRKVHGGASRLAGTETEAPARREAFVEAPPEAVALLTSFEQRKMQNDAQKEAIAAAALSYIQDNQCIVLDASSTALRLAKKLAAFSKLLVVTNGIFIMLTLKEMPGIDTVIIGGFVSKRSGFINGTIGAEILDRFHIDTAFVSARGFSEKDGLTDFDLYEVELKRLMLKNCKHIVAMVDSSKLECVSAASFLPADAIGTLLTDDGIAPALLERYRAHGLNIRVCPCRKT